MQRQNPKDDSEHRNALNADTNNGPATGSIPFVKPIHAIDPCACNTSITIVKKYNGLASFNAHDIILCIYVA